MSSQPSRPYSDSERPRLLGLLTSLLQVLIMLALMTAAVVLLTQSVFARGGREGIHSTAEHDPRMETLLALRWQTVPARAER